MLETVIVVFHRIVSEKKLRALKIGPDFFLSCWYPVKLREDCKGMHDSQVECNSFCKRLCNKRMSTRHNTHISAELKVKEHMWVLWILFEEQEERQWLQKESMKEVAILSKYGETRFRSPRVAAIVTTAVKGPQKINFVSFYLKWLWLFLFSVHLTCWLCITIQLKFS